MAEPTLVVLAAGMGSRFGGLKQITPIDDAGHLIIDYSLYDAYRAGFRRVAFVIKHAIEADFKEKIGRRMERYFDVQYIYQELDCLPEGFAVPEGRVKPWGTGHAVACLTGQVDGPFAVINSDDFYGAAAYRVIYAFLRQDGADTDYAMVGFPLRNTLSDNGSVSRGICQTENGMLTDVVERTKIIRQGDGGAFTEDGVHYAFLPGDTPVSMNFWGFRPGILTELGRNFPAFLREGLRTNPLKCEYLLPAEANRQLHRGEATVKMLHTDDSWFGVTYPDDLPGVKSAVAALKQAGKYPEKLWN